MRQSIIKVGVDNFLNTIKFNKEYHIIYNNVFNNRIDFTYEIFLYFILQAALQNKFNGYFDELYVDVFKRKSHYIKQLTNNFKTAYMGEPSNYDKFMKYFCFCIKEKQSDKEKEIYFYRSLSAYFDFDRTIDLFFELKNEEKQKKFIDFCEIIYKKKMNEELDSRVQTKIKKKVSFKLSN